MSKPNWDALTEQLRDDPDPNLRRKACQQLAATHDPAVIPFLRNAYLSDEDERVRDTARDALAAFKSSKEGKSVRSLPISDRILTAICGGLAFLFVISLALHALASGGSKDQKVQIDDSWKNTKPTDRNEVIKQIQAKFNEDQATAASLRNEVKNYNGTGQVKCPLTYTIPAPLQLAQINVYTYPDLGIVGATLDSAPNGLQKALVLLNSACAAPATQTERVLQASSELDNVDALLGKTMTLLQAAITNPAPTVGPTVTPLPTWTFTPSPTATATPITPTATGTVTLPATETPIASVTPAATSTPEPTLSPVPTLPFPTFDYAPILSELSKRYRAVIGDLKNTYGTGMIDQWQKSISEGGQQSTRSCQLQSWPAPFALTDAQLAELHGGKNADPQLEDAVRLQQEGLDLAVQARALFERDCSAKALATSAQDGMALAQQALDKLAQSQDLYDAIRARPK